MLHRFGWALSGALALIAILALGRALEAGRSTRRDRWGRRCGRSTRWCRRGGRRCRRAAGATRSGFSA